MQFSDIHIHALHNCDDGAKSLEYMYKMIDVAYVDGARFICLTPHYNPGEFGENSKQAQSSYNTLLEYSKERYPDLCLGLGNELRYNSGCEDWLSDKRCRSMNDSRYVLVDFFSGESKQTISNGLSRILNKGYIPILAHPERNAEIKGDLAFLKKQRDNGALIQIDARSIFGDFGFCTRLFARKILKHHLADFVSSDAHNLKTRPPGIKEAYEYIRKKHGISYAEDVCCKNALHMIFGRSL